MTGKVDELMSKSVAVKVARAFSGDLKESDVQANALVDADEAEREAALDMFVAIKAMDVLSKNAEITQLAAAPAPARIWGKRHWGWGMAAAILMAIGVIFSVSYNSEKSSFSHVKRYVTKVGEQKEITLEDGSQLTINTNSEVLVDLSVESRNLTLVRGEVYFDVAKDESRPFRIALGERLLTVLGTKFSIFKRPESFTVSVSEGMVAVHKSTVEAVPGMLPLVPGESDDARVVNNPGPRSIGAGVIARFDASKNNVSVSKLTNIVDSFGWRKGMLRFENVPLSSVVKELNRYSPKKILIENSNLMDINVFAVIRVDGIGVALSNLEKTLPIKVINYIDRTVIDVDK